MRYGHMYSNDDSHMCRGVDAFSPRRSRLHRSRIRALLFGFVSFGNQRVQLPLFRTVKPTLCLRWQAQRWEGSAVPASRFCRQLCSGSSLLLWEQISLTATFFSMEQHGMTKDQGDEWSGPGRRREPVYHGFPSGMALLYVNPKFFAPSSFTSRFGLPAVMHGRQAGPEREGLNQIGMRCRPVQPMCHRPRTGGLIRE